MAEKIKKGFFKVLPLSVVIFLVASLVITFTAPTPQNPEVSQILAAGDNTVTEIRLLDMDGDGEMDSARVQVTNVATSAAKIWGTTGWSATDNAGVDPVTITGVAFDTNDDNIGDAATSNASPLVIIVTLDETDVTQDDTLNADLEIMYAQQGADAGTEYTDVGNVQLVAILTGDAGGATNTENDGAKPIFVSALTGDNDSDGTVDRLVMTFSESVTVTDGGTDDDITLGAAPGAATVTAGVYDTVGTTLTYVISVTATSNTAVIVSPTYTTAGAGIISDGINEVAMGETVVGTDGAKPAFISALTGDNNTDGTVDRLVMTFSEPVTITDGGTDDDITLVASTGTATVTAGVYGAVGATTLTYTISVSATGNTAITIDPTYAIGGAGSISDTVNEMADGETVVGTDGAKPAFISALTGDNNTDGTVDRLVMTFSEPVTITDGGTDDDITLVASTGTATVTAGVYGAVGATTLTYTISVSATGNTAITIDPTYAIGGAGSISDTVNEMADGETVVGTDGAKPAFISALTGDNNTDGTVDRLVMTFSEPVTITDGGTDDDITLVASTGTATVTAGVYGAVGATTLTYTISVSATGNTAITIDPTYAIGGAGSISDTVNEMADGETVVGTDGAKPAFISALTGDNNTDGTVDRLVMTFSEPVTITDGGTDDDITLVASTGTATVTAGVYGAVGATTLTYTISVSATGNTAITIDPTYAIGGAGSISDTVNEMADGETVVGTDGAKPAFISALTGDNNTDGTVDRLVMTFSEPVTITDGGTDDDITLVASTGTATVTAGVYGAVGATTLTYTISVSATGNTAITIDPTYAIGGAGSISDTVNEMADGETVVGTDGAKPAFISALTGDNNTDGTVDRLVMTFSEPVTITDGGTDDDITLVASTGTATVTAGVYGAVGATTLTYTISVSATGNTAITIDPTYAIGGAGSISDTVNEMADGETVVGTDGAKPAFISALTGDNNTDGTVDRLVMTFSEPVTITDGGTDDDITLVASTGTATVTAGSYGAVGTTTLTYVISVSATSNTAITVTPTYATGGAGSISDTVNEMLNTETVTGTDAAKPAILTATFYDADVAPNDGKLDLITVVWSENISAVADGSADWSATSAANFAAMADTAAICNSGAAAANECRITISTTTVKTSVGDLSLAYTAGTSVTDGTNTALSKTITSASTPAFTDGANPVVASTSPADGASGVALDASFSLTFSEAMTTTDITTTTLGRSPTFTLGSVNGTWTVDNTVVTFAAHDPWAGLQIYTINLVQGSITSAVGGLTLDNTAIVADPYTFTTVAASGGGGGGGGGGLPASVTVTAPNGGGTLTGGGSSNITWSAPGVADTINLYYSLDSGINFPYTIATAQTNDGSYTWTVPNVSSSTVKVKAVSGSLNDISDANFTITYTTPDVSLANSTIVASPTSVVADGTSFSTITVTVKDAASVPLSGKVVTLASSRGATDTVTTVTGTTGADGKATFTVYSGTAGTSTYTVTAQGTVLSSTVSVVFTAVGEPTTPGEGETPTSISVGDLIKSPLSTSVYYYGSDNKRHVFPNEKTYKSWYVDFSNIKSVTASQLQGIALGHNVTVRPGTVLLKIDTDPKVYAVEPGGLLRWVPTEARALTLYGSAWASRIIDVPLVFWVDYSFGSDITTDQHTTGSLIQYTGTTDKYYIQGAERRLLSTEGFTANKFQLSNVLATPTTISYTLGTPITVEDTTLTRIY